MSHKDLIEATCRELGRSSLDDLLSLADTNGKVARGFAPDRLVFFNGMIGPGPLKDRLTEDQLASFVNAPWGHTTGVSYRSRQSMVGKQPDVILRLILGDRKDALGSIVQQLESVLPDAILLENPCCCVMVLDGDFLYETHNLSAQNPNVVETYIDLTWKVVSWSPAETYEAV